MCLNFIIYEPFVIPFCVFCSDILNDKETIDQGLVLQKKNVRKS